MRVPIIRLSCRRCSHTWVPRQADVRLCPACKSARYDTPKASDKKAKSLDQIRSALARVKDRLKNEFSVNDIYIFGSYVRGKQTTNSDVDLLVDLGKPLGLRFLTLKRYLEDVLDLSVDLAALDAVKKNRRQAIFKEMIRV